MIDDFAQMLESFKETHFEDLRKEIREGLQNMKGMWDFCIRVLQEISPEDTQGNLIPLTPPPVGLSPRQES